MAARKSLQKLVLLVVVGGLGVVSRHYPVGRMFWDKWLGDLCYGAGVFLIMALIVPRRPTTVAAYALLFCVGIECFKLTGLPKQWDSHFILRVVFGTTFSWQNIACYAMGIGAMMGIECIIKN
jgi:hypothetical protein